MMTNHLELSRKDRNFFSMPIEALSRFWNSVESSSRMENFPEPMYLAYDIILGA